MPCNDLHLFISNLQTVLLVGVLQFMYVITKAEKSQALYSWQAGAPRQLIAEFQSEAENRCPNLKTVRQRGVKAPLSSLLFYLCLQLIGWGPPMLGESNLLDSVYQFKWQFHPETSSLTHPEQCNVWAQSSWYINLTMTDRETGA